MGPALETAVPEQVGAAAEDAVTVTAARRMPALLRAMRPLQWTKNALVFAPLLFGKQVFHLDAFLHAVGAAIAFCAVSSGIYLINDLRDVEQDRLHPKKRSRPIAAGE